MLSLHSHCFRAFVLTTWKLLPWSCLDRSHRLYPPLLRSYPSLFQITLFLFAPATIFRTLHVFHVSLSSGYTVGSYYPNPFEVICGRVTLASEISAEVTCVTFKYQCQELAYDLYITHDYKIIKCKKKKKQ